MGKPNACATLLVCHDLGHAAHEARMPGKVPDTLKDLGRPAHLAVTLASKIMLHLQGPAGHVRSGAIEPATQLVKGSPRPLSSEVQWDHSERSPAKIALQL